VSGSGFDVLLAGAGLDPADRQALAALEEMLTLVPDEAPRPSAELQAVLDGGPSMPRRPGHPLRTGVVAGLLGLTATVGIGAAAAAADDLPPGVQRAVSVWSHRHLPFAFPMPDRSPHAASVPRRPAPSATTLPAPHLPPPSAVTTRRHSDVAATPAARPAESSPAAPGASPSGHHHAGGSSPTPSATGSPSHPAGDHAQEPGSAGHGGSAAGAKGQHPTGRPVQVPSAQSKRQDTEHRADKHGNSSGHRRMTQSRRDRSPGGP
jgi:hypothetical protein